MTDYSKMSDFEINKLVAETLNKSRSDGSKFERIFAESLANFAESGRFDPCNNPSDAWPIIVDNKINLNWLITNNTWCAFIKLNTPDVIHKNPLRAAMICYLLLEGG